MSKERIKKCPTAAYLDNADKTLLDAQSLGGPVGIRTVGQMGGNMQPIEILLDGKDAHQCIPRDMGGYISFHCPLCPELEIRMDKDTEEIKTVSGIGNKHRHTGMFLFRNQ